MLRKLLFITLCCSLLGGMAAAQTVEEILNSYYEARGGLGKIKAIQTLRMTGKMVGGDMETPFVIEQKRPNKNRMEFTMQGVTGVRAFDGETAWMHMPFMGKSEPEEMPSEQAEKVKENADFDGLLVDWQEKGHKIELMGTEEAEGADAFKLKVTKKDGEIEYYFLDVEYYLPILIKGSTKMGESEIEYESSIGDYKEVEGVIFPFSMENRSPGGGFSQSMAIDTIELNVEIDDSRFVMPEAEKKEAGGKEQGTLLIPTVVKDTEKAEDKGADKDQEPAGEKAEEKAEDKAGEGAEDNSED